MVVEVGDNEQAAPHPEACLETVRLAVVVPPPQVAVHGVHDPHGLKAQSTTVGQAEESGTVHCPAEDPVIAQEYLIHPSHPEVIAEQSTGEYVKAPVPLFASLSQVQVLQVWYGQGFAVGLQTPLTRV